MTTNSIRPDGILFSQVYDVPSSARDSWFDPALNVDTPLFVDPFLLEWISEPEFEGAFDDVFLHFRRLFHALADDPGGRVDQFLMFPEVPETCLGYTAHGVLGSGGGGHAAAEIRRAMVSAIQAGLAAPRHFEEVGLLGPGVGKDRISDITTRLILPRLARYTARMCDELGIEPRAYRLWSYQQRGGRPTRVVEEFRLPANPHANRAVLLVPKFLLRRLPTINRNSFEDYLWESHAEELRRDFNIETKRDLRPRVLDLARRNLEWVRAYVEHEEQRGARPYPFQRDPSGFVYPYQVGYVWGRAIVPGIDPAQFAGDLHGFVGFLADAFKAQVENRDGWRNLWDSTLSDPLPEDAAQRLFHAMSRPVSTFVGIDITPEANAGVGPVDFKFSVGSNEIVLVEVKLVSNSQYWDGPAAQLPAYLRSHDAEKAWFLVIAHTDEQVRSNRWTDLGPRVADAERETGVRVSERRVDGRRRLPASRRRPGRATR